MALAGGARWLLDPAHVLDRAAIEALSADVIAEVARLCPRPSGSVHCTSRGPNGAVLSAGFASSTERALSTGVGEDGECHVNAPLAARRLPLSRLAGRDGSVWSDAAALLGCEGNSFAIGAQDSHFFAGIILMASGRARVVESSATFGGPDPGGAAQRAVLEFESLAALASAMPGLAYACCGYRHHDVSDCVLAATLSVSAALRRCEQAGEAGAPGVHVLLLERTDATMDDVIDLLPLLADLGERDADGEPDGGSPAVGALLAHARVVSADDLVALEGEVEVRSRWNELVGLAARSADGDDADGGDQDDADDSGEEVAG